MVVLAKKNGGAITYEQDKADYALCHIMTFILGNTPPFLDDDLANMASEMEFRNIKASIILTVVPSSSVMIH
ncbi:hypothetical protein diail_1103 [Diaporthe ilicicola]|nr:hypothetical protein diail_1103 [Diaporthe ilicicola]